MDKSGAPSQSESSLGPVDDSKSVRSSAVDVEDVVEKLQEDPRRCWEWKTFLKDLGPSGSQDVARWYDRYLASSWLTVRLYLHLQLQGFEASDCKIHYNPSQSQPKTINPIFSEPKLRHAAMRALQSRQSSGSQAPDRICLQLVGGQIHGCGALVALDVS